METNIPSHNPYVIFGEATCNNWTEEWWAGRWILAVFIPCVYVGLVRENGQ